MDFVVQGLGQKLCLVMVTWAGTAGQCYQVANARSTGYAAVAALILVAGYIGVALTRRFRI
jgi:hypothetical protein